VNLGRETIGSEVGFILQTVFKNEFALGTKSILFSLSFFARSNLNLFVSFYGIVDPIRNLVWRSLKTPYVLSSSLQLSKIQFEYLCVAQEGQQYTKNELAGLTAWWIQVTQILTQPQLAILKYIHLQYIAREGRNCS
jgi:hypothetical protein